MDVRDVDALVTEFRPKLLAAGLPAGEGPKDQSWGKREYWAPVPGGGFIIFGQEIPKMPEVTPPGSISGLRVALRSAYAWCGRLV